MNRVLKRLIILLLLMPILCILSCALFDLNARVQREYRDSLNDSQKYVIGFVDLLGSGWKATEVMKDYEDIRGWSDTIAGRSQIWTYNLSDPLAFVKNHVIAYVDNGSAQEGFQNQQTTLSYGRDKITFPKDQFRVFSLSENLSLKSQMIYTGCLELAIETECDGLFLYGRYVVYINVYLKRHGKIYMSLQDLEKIYTIMDNHMSQLVH